MITFFYESRNIEERLNRFLSDRFIVKSGCNFLQYVILLLVVLVFEISMVIVAFGLKGNAASEIQSTMRDSLNQYGSQWQVTKIWDELQMEVKLLTYSLCVCDLYL